MDRLEHHRTIRESGWQGRVITTYRPDPVVDPEHELFRPALTEFGELTGKDVHNWRDYLEAHRIRRAFFAKAGATATDHGHPTALTADLSTAECEKLFAQIVVEEGQTVLGWRTVPTNNSSLGFTAKASEPFVRQVFIGRNAKLADDMSFERKLYVIRKRAENLIRYGRKTLCALGRCACHGLPSLPSRYKQSAGNMSKLCHKI